jgi:hypothetical protein
MMKSRLLWLVVPIVASMAILVSPPGGFFGPHGDVQSVDLSSSHAVMYAHVPVGAVCTEHRVAELGGLHTVRLGDTVDVGGNSFRVGFIDVRDGDMTFDGHGNRRGFHTQCELAASPEKTSVQDAECHALWIRVEPCKYFRPAML